jgi:hypothetical protein
MKRTITLREERADTKWMHCPLCGKTDHEGYVPVGPATAALVANPKGV